MTTTRIKASNTSEGVPVEPKYKLSLFDTSGKLADNSLQMIVDQACQEFYKQYAANADFKWHVVFQLHQNMDQRLLHGMFASVSFVKKQQALDWIKKLINATKAYAPNGKTIIFSKIKGMNHPTKYKMRWE